MSWFPGNLTPRPRRPLAAVVALLLLATPPAAAAVRDTFAPLGPIEEPAPPGEDREDAPDPQPNLPLAPVRLANPLPGDRRSGNPLSTPFPLSRAALAHPTRSAPVTLLGNGLGFRLRC